jgi:micrococcal nuclease
MVKKLLVALFASTILFSTAKAANIIEVFANVEYVRAYDGDTITVNIPNLPAVFGERISIRVRGVDTPEIRAKCDNEKYLAIRARNYVRNLLETAQKVDLINPERGKYFRIVADVRFDGADLKDSLLQMGYAVRYDGGRKSNPWCPDF